MTIIRDIARDMKDYVPRYYLDSKIMNGGVLDPEIAEFLALNQEIRAVLDQFFIDTSTWAIDRWERLCGITPDINKALDDRRSLVKSKLRGVGTVTVAMLKNVGGAFINGEVLVTEKPSTYEVEIKFISTRGVPTNQPDIETTIRSIVPAHLGVTFVITFLSWDELEGQLMISNTLDTYTWNVLETSFL
jgi:hypothetical protein